MKVPQTVFGFAIEKGEAGGKDYFSTDPVDAMEVRSYNGLPDSTEVEIITYQKVSSRRVKLVDLNPNDYQ